MDLLAQGIKDGDLPTFMPEAVMLLVSMILAALVAYLVCVWHEHRKRK